MLQTSAPFPYPGSIAMLDGLAFTVQRLNADGTATISRDGSGASFRRNADISELIDPKEAAKNDRIAMTDLGEASKRIGQRIAKLVKGINEVRFSELRHTLTDEANKGRIPRPDGGLQVAQLLRRLGWKKQGMVQAAGGITSLYVREAHQ
jgi:hypothetical protein